MKTDEIVIEFSADQFKSLRSELGFHDMYALEMKLRYLAKFFEKQIYSIGKVAMGNIATVWILDRY